MIPISQFEIVKPTMNLVNNTYAIEAMPMGAPGCPDLALKERSACHGTWVSVDALDDTAGKRSDTITY